MQQGFWVVGAATAVGGVLIVCFASRIASFTRTSRFASFTRSKVERELAKRDRYLLGDPSRNRIFGFAAIAVGLLVVVLALAGVL